jgi:hypothetical protein
VSLPALPEMTSALRVPRRLSFPAVPMTVFVSAAVAKTSASTTKAVVTTNCRTTSSNPFGVASHSSAAFPCDRPNSNQDAEAASGLPPKPNRQRCSLLATLSSRSGWFSDKTVPANSTS